MIAASAGLAGRAAPQHDPRRAASWLFAGLLLLYVAITGGHVDAPDGVVMARTAGGGARWARLATARLRQDVFFRAAGGARADAGGVGGGALAAAALGGACRRRRRRARRGGARQGRPPGAAAGGSGGGVARRARRR